MAKNGRPTRSNAAKGTSQVWVDDDIHQELVRQKAIQRRTIKTIAEFHLRNALGLPHPDEASEG